MIYVKATKSAKQFRTEAERLFLKGNPEAVILEWEFQTLYETRIKPIVPCRSGAFYAARPGERPQRVNASWIQGSGLSVR